ncbi:MAG: VWA domain-containing protein, partial [Planctomycetes bacterium]|nr:VWA domain-containing protein [Planctomycetota bacterium]
VNLDPNKNKKRAVVLMLDRSESMNGFIGSVSKISRVCSAGIEFLSNFKSADACALVSFAEKADERGETVNLAKLSDEVTRKIVERLEILGNTPNLFGRTNLEEALRVGIGKLSKRSEETKLLILFSDGTPTIGASKAEEFTVLIDSALKNNVHVSFIVAGGKNDLFQKLTKQLGKLGSAEYLAENWQVNEAFQKALLNAGGKLIDSEMTTVLTDDKKLFLDYPQLNGYVRTIIKKFNDAKALLVSSKHEPLLASWMLGNTRTSAIMLPFNDFDLFWQDLLPRKIGQYLKNHFRMLFESSEADIEVQTEFDKNSVTLRIRDIAKDRIQEYFMVIDKRKIELKPVKPGIYEANFSIENSVTGKIVENGRTIIPISLDIPNYKEFFEISAKLEKLKQLFNKYFSESNAKEKLADCVKSAQSKLYSLNKILLLLSILLIIFWSFLYAYTSRK